MIQCLDHVVLTVRNLNAAADFYRRILGMTPALLDDGRVSLHFGNQKINLHPLDNDIVPVATNPTPGTADLCLVTNASPHEVVNHLQASAVEIILGPISRVGALGPMESVYIRDPDGNLIEIASYPSTDHG